LAVGCDRVRAHLTGSCHCGAQKIAFDTDRPLAPRACQCAFCRRHGARTVTDPSGTAVLTLGPQARLYRFAMHSADFVLCGRCGAYLGGVTVIDGRTFATLNLNAFDNPRPDLDAAPVSYEGEAFDEKSGRRRRAWTPATLHGG
jgi:hypothetical protein